MSNEWIPVAAAGVGAVAVLAANAVNPFIARGTAHKQWLKDKRAVLCEEYVATLQQAEKDITSNINRRKNKIGGKDPEKTYMIGQQLTRDGSRLDLYASRRLQVLIEETNTVLIDLTFSLLLDESEADVNTATSRFETLALETKAEIRKLLGLN